MDCAALRTSSRTELRTDWVGWWGDQRVLLSYPANSDRSHPLSLSTPSILVSHHQKKILVSPRVIPNHITAPGQPPSGSRATRRCDLVVFPIDYDLSILFPMPYVIIQCVIAACTIQYISRSSSKFHLINNVSYLFHLELRVEINHLWFLFFITSVEQNHALQKLCLHSMTWKMKLSPHFCKHQMSCKSKNLCVLCISYEIVHGSLEPIIGTITREQVC